jgi:hypothetical protein
MSIQHQTLASGRWQEMTFHEQMANIGSEVERSLNWKDKGNSEYSWMAFDRALELLEITVADDKNKKRLKELARLKEFLSDYFAFGNSYHSTRKNWHDYFFGFNYMSRLKN